ncbi:MAG: hypothetical protein IT389_01130 [Nitrospira sp.]|nr:hypothetical protein [Nitrospira sp.]
MKQDFLIALFKLGRKDHMAELLHEGHIFMNTAGYFSVLEDSSPRSDPEEGVGYCKNGDGMILKMEDQGDWLTLGNIIGPILFPSKTNKSVNIYSLHSKWSCDYGVPFRLSDLGFGDSFVLFIDTTEFFKRLERAAVNEGLELRWGRIDYVDRCTYSGPMGLFRKFSQSAGHQEFRVVVSPGTGCPLSLRLGDLSDIAIMGSSSERLLLERKLSNGEPVSATDLES